MNGAWACSRYADSERNRNNNKLEYLHKILCMCSFRFKVLIILSFPKLESIIFMHHALESFSRVQNLRLLSQHSNEFRKYEDEYLSSFSLLIRVCTIKIHFYLVCDSLKEAKSSCDFLGYESKVGTETLIPSISMSVMVMGQRKWK